MSVSNFLRRLQHQPCIIRHCYNSESLSLVLSGLVCFPIQNKKNKRSSRFSSVCDGFGKAVNKCTSLGISSDFTTVICLMAVRYLLRHCAISASICDIFGSKLVVVMLSLLVAKSYAQYLYTVDKLYTKYIFVIRLCCITYLKTRCFLLYFRFNT